MIQRRSSRGPSRLWALAYRLRLARAELPFWRVVAEVRPLPHTRYWPSRAESAVTAVFVWADTAEEAEGLAALALENEALSTMTADAASAPPALRPSRTPIALARTPLFYLQYVEPGAQAPASTSRARGN